MKIDNFDTEKIQMQKDEKKGLYVLLGILLISWGMIITPWGMMRLVGWLAMGVSLFTLWRVIDNLLERAKIDVNKKEDKE